MAGLQWQRHSLWCARLHQGYLSRPGDGLTVRVRTSEPIEGGADPQAWLTLKAPPPSPVGGGPLRPSASAAGVPQALSRLEFEYGIPLEDAQAMLALTTQQVVKCRHGLDLGGGDWVLDVFEGENAPLVVAEVELLHPDQRVEVPLWCVRELTGRHELSNAALASTPLAQWSEAQRWALLGKDRSWP
ncbi:MAG: adenylate cyclase [Cyanobium sp.]